MITNAKIVPTNNTTTVDASNQLVIVDKIMFEEAAVDNETCIHH